MALRLSSIRLRTDLPKSSGMIPLQPHFQPFALLRQRIDRAA